MQSEADRELESQDRAFKFYARCYMLTTAAANEISRKYPQIRDFNPDDVKRWATIDVISDLNRHGTDAVRPAIEGPPIEDQPFYESLLNSDWCADPIAAAAYSAHLVANPNDAVGAKAAGQAATMAAINAVAAGVANAVLPVPYTNEQLHYLYGSAGSAAYFDNFTKKHKEYVNSNHKLWGYIEEACSKQRDITAYINKRFDDLAPAERVQLPGNTLLNEIVVHFHRDTEREQMHSREIFYQTMLIHSAYDTALELEDCAFNLRKRGVEVSDNELRDRLLVCMENSVKYRELAGIITTRMRFSIPNPGAAAGPHHGVTWESLKREVRNYDLDQGNIVNKRSQRRRASEFTSRVPRGHSRNTFLNTRSRSRSGSRGRSRSRSRERSSDYSSRILSKSPYRYASSATSDSNGQSSSRQKSPSGERHYRSPSPHPHAQSSTTPRSKLVCKICNKVGHRPDQCRLRSRSSGSNRGRSPSRNVTFDSILKKAIRCFLCGQDHRVKDCPLKTKFMAEQRANMAITSTPEESYDSEDITEETIAETYASMLFALHPLTRGVFLDSGSSAEFFMQSEICVGILELEDDLALSDPLSEFEDEVSPPDEVQVISNKIVPAHNNLSSESLPPGNNIFVSPELFVYHENGSVVSISSKADDIFDTPDISSMQARVSLSKKTQILDSASATSPPPSNFSQISNSVSNISNIDSVVADYTREYIEENDSASVQEVDNSFKLHLTPAIWLLRNERRRKVISESSRDLPQHQILPSFAKYLKKLADTSRNPLGLSHHFIRRSVLQKLIPEGIAFNWGRYPVQYHYDPSLVHSKVDTYNVDKIHQIRKLSSKVDFAKFKLYLRNYKCALTCATRQTNPVGLLWDNYPLIDPENSYPSRREQRYCTFCLRGERGPRCTPKEVIDLSDCYLFAQTPVDAPLLAPTSPSTTAPEISLEVAPVIPAESSTSILPSPTRPPLKSIENSPFSPVAPEYSPLKSPSFYARSLDSFASEAADEIENTPVLLNMVVAEDSDDSADSFEANSRPTCSSLVAKILSEQFLVRREEISSDLYNKSTKLAANAANCAYRRGYPNYFCLCCRVGYMGPYCTIVMEARMDHISASNSHPEDPSDEPAILSPMLSSDLDAANEITYMPDSLPSETAANTTESELVEDRVSESPEKRRRSERVACKSESKFPRLAYPVLFDNKRLRTSEPVKSWPERLPDPVKYKITSVTKCLIDSGCSTTVIPNRELFEGDLKKTVGTIRIISADKNSNLECNYLGKCAPFYNALWIPEADQVLVSMGDLDELGIEIRVQGGILIGSYQGRQIFHVRKVGNVWISNFEKLCDKLLEHLPRRVEFGVELWGNQRVANLAVSVPEMQRVYQLLHYRLCHRNMRDVLRAMSQKRIFVGKEYNCLLTNMQRTLFDCSTKCDSCEKAKSHALPHPAVKPSKAPAPIKSSASRSLSKESAVDIEMQRGHLEGSISTDTTGPYSVPSIIGGYVGNQTFIKRDSKRAYFYPYRLKSDAYDNLRHLVDTRFKMERFDLKHYHSDGAGELSGKQVRSYLNGKGCQTTWTTLANPQQNSTSERHFRTESEGAQAMMSHARFLPTGLWNFAKEAFTYVYNHFPTTTARGWMSPMEYETGVVPDLSRLRVWGCKCWVNIPKSLRHKDWAAKSKVGYMMGYSEFQIDAYKIWIPATNKIIIARDVKFDEIIPQGDVDHATDEYWRDVRLFTKVTGQRSPKDVEDFEHLVGNIFYDPDVQEMNIVTRIDVYNRNIVGWLAKVVDGVQQGDEHATMHVADIEKLLGVYQPVDGEERGMVAMESTPTHALLTREQSRAGK